ncbi:MAG TPA: neutral zinc metallopeptidase [Acidimicrobiales bacterium]|nr:neutral zinc metallopeptidase [Acidimicrobiales bacterium]
MRFRRDANLDTSQIGDRRGMRAGGPVLAGGGLIGLVFLVVSLLAGGGGDGSGLQLGSDESTSDLSAQCRTGDDANQRDDCRIVGVVNSVQRFWEGQLQGYRRARTVFFEGATQTGCGNATSAVGPFYCPLDQTIYIDLGFYGDLRTRFGARGGPFAEAYVIAHEYGHHVENLLGVLDRAKRGDAGAESDSVKVELMADCLAGMWARGAVDTGYIEELTDADIRDGLDAAAAVGDDRIQERAQGRVDPESWTHGSAEQRQRWFSTGFRTTNVEQCRTL